MLDRDKLRAYLLPGEAERDPKFRQEVMRQSRVGLRLIAALAVGLPLLLLLARVPVLPDPLNAAARLAPSIAIIAGGAAALALACARWCRPHARLLSAVLIGAIAAVLICGAVFGSAQAAGADRRLSGDITLLMLLAVAAVPLRPLEALALGLAIEGVNLASTLASGRPFDALEHVFLALLALLAAGLAAAVYRWRVDLYTGREHALKMNELLSTAQQRVLLSENAASLGRLANTLVHELNNPLGALSSAVDTLMVVSSRLATATEEQRPRLVQLEADLRRSVQSSIERLRKTIARIQRLTGLDEAEFQSVDLNELLKDVASLVESRFQQAVKVEFDLQPLGELTCQPQQLAAVFSNLLTNAATAMKGRGAILVSTRQNDGVAEIRVRDSGCGMSKEQLAGIFEPGFRAADGRMATGNWNLYSCRQIVHGHGGEIYMMSEEGKGCTVVMTVPL